MCILLVLMYISKLINFCFLYKIEEFLCLIVRNLVHRLYMCVKRKDSGPVWSDCPDAQVDMSLSCLHLFSPFHATSVCYIS